MELKKGMTVHISFSFEPITEPLTGEIVTITAVSILILPTKESWYRLLEKRVSRDTYREELNDRIIGKYMEEKQCYNVLWENIRRLYCDEWR